MQAPTQNANKRPYGIAMLVANYDDELGKPKLYHICSSAVVNECKAYAIGLLYFLMESKFLSLTIFFIH